jgi:hypothetical protein
MLCDRERESVLCVWGNEGWEKAVGLVEARVIGFVSNPYRLQLVEYG